MGSAYAINDAAFSVGTVTDFANGGDAFGTSTGTPVAALWSSTGGVTNLNTLIPTVTANSAAPGWVLLSQASAITNDGWISGVGTYNPGGGLPDYNRAFLIQDTSILLLGDANGDGKVDLNDLNIVLNNLGTTTSLRSHGNFDGTATIDLNDLNDVLNNLGTSLSGDIANRVAAAHIALTPENVPEPGSFAVQSLASIALLRRKRRNR